MCNSFQRMRSANTNTNSAPRRERSNRRSLLDHLVDSVANLSEHIAPELERETSFSTTNNSTSAAVRPQTSSESQYYQDASTSTSSFVSFWESTTSASTSKHVKLRDLNEDTSASSTQLISSLSSSWSTTRGHLVVAEEILSQLESETVDYSQDDEQQKEQPGDDLEMQEEHDDSIHDAGKIADHDPFAQDSKFTVDADGLITLSSLLPDHEDTNSPKNTKRSRTNRAA